VRTGRSSHFILISAKPDLYTSKRFIKAGGDSIRIVSPLSSDENIDGNSALVIPRFSSYYRAEGLELLQALENKGAVSLNSSNKISVFSDKWSAYQDFMKHRIPTVETSLDPYSFSGETCLVSKPRISSKGSGVSLLDISKEMEAFRHIKNGYIFQRFIRESMNSDIRVLVCGSEILGSYRRYSCKSNEFRSNVSLGGKTAEYVLTRDELSLINQIIPICGRGFYGIDIIQTFDGPKVLEVNYCPGFEAFEEISGLVVAERVFEVLKVM
jgi:RimK family alpha-L-glutamate ligase